MLFYKKLRIKREESCLYSNLQKKTEESSSGLVFLQTYPSA